MQHSACASAVTAGKQAARDVLPDRRDATLSSSASPAASSTGSNRRFSHIRSTSPTGGGPGRPSDSAARSRRATGPQQDRLNRRRDVSLTCRAARLLETLARYAAIVNGCSFIGSITPDRRYATVSADVADVFIRCRKRLRSAPTAQGGHAAGTGTCALLHILALIPTKYVRPTTS